jgi:3-methyladenine DNA glycosylase AlkD
MTAEEVLTELENLGTAQNRKIYARHGVPPQNLYGVSYGNLEKLRKRLKIDQSLAVDLWKSGIHDARILACKIADAGAISGKTLDAWCRDLHSCVEAGELAALVARTRHAEARRAKWTASKDERVGTAGWHLVCLAANDPAGPWPDSVFEAYLAWIEGAIHQAKNQVRETMNTAVMAIGLRNPTLRKKAIAAARRIGPVEVDHGETSCRTPDAEAYILKALATRAAMAARKKAATATGKGKGGC